jgi:hypothetical protein
MRLCLLSLAPQGLYLLDLSPSAAAVSDQNEAAAEVRAHHIRTVRAVYYHGC